MKKIILLISILLFFIYFPLVKSIDFMQNDDWVYYENVKTFMTGDMSLHSYVGPTFYFQGLLASLYSKIFSIQNLPVLNLVFAVLSFFLFTLILYKYFQRGKMESVLIGLILFFNPLFIHSFLGFMTDIYFLPLLLTFIYVFLEYERTHNTNYILLSFVVLFVALLQRQVTLFIPLAITIYALSRKEVTLGLIYFFLFTIMALYYMFVFPQTSAMMNKAFSIHHLWEFDRMYSILYGFLIMLCAFTIPLVLYSLKVREIKKKILFLLTFGILFFVFNHFHHPEIINWGEFPYFENTFERGGLYPRGVDGTKYLFRWNFDMYRFWDIAAKILAAALISSIVFLRKKVINLYSVLLVCYMGAMVVTQRFFDRYFLVMLPLFVFYILSINKGTKMSLINRFLSLGFVIFFVVLTYQFSMDFYKVNKYVWHKSEELVKNGVAPNKIQGTNAWKMKYRNYNSSYSYSFSYDSPEMNEGYKEYWELVEVKDIEFPLNIFTNPKIYLYTR